MASSMLTSDRRWVTTRKSGLTVLGKVPKPINLPSQRLENHGLDPNVEIVPKGTLTWGSRPSLAAPNAWGTPVVSSPNADGSVGSPSHHPSSGGSGTRPSTAGSDRSHDPLANAWGPNSRPSSASGILASSQISAATRPQSAETRPGSAQLSRFADNSVDSTLRWGAAGTAERLGTVSSKSSGFNLSPGDFPSLGSDVNSDTHSQRGQSSHGRPRSSQSRPHSSQSRPHSSQERPASDCGIDSKQKDILKPPLAGDRNTDHSDSGTVNTWKADNFPYAGPAVSPKMENWHGNSRPSPPYPNINMPPPHYDYWHDPPFHHADGAWYRGGASGGPYRPYRPPGPPASYPPDYHHGSSRPPSNPQFPRQEAGPGGFYPNNCEPYRPYMPPARYMGPSHPGIPVRPGAYAGPPPFEGYYGPPRPNFYNSTEREASLMGISRPVNHNQYPNQHQNSDSVNFHARPGGYATVANKEQRMPDQAHETKGRYRVLLKQHDGSEDHDEQAKTERSVTVGSLHFQNGHNPTGVSIHANLGKRDQMQEETGSPSLPAELVSFQPTSGVDDQSADVRNTVADSRKAADEGLLRRPEAVNAQSRDPQQYPVIKKNESLMEKVEGLNNKARIADNHNEDGTISSKEKPTCFKDVTATVDRFAKVPCTEANPAEHVDIIHNLKTEVPRVSNVLSDNKNQESTDQGQKFSVPFNSVGSGENTYFPGHRKVHVAENVDHRTRVGSNRHGNDERMEKPPSSESSMNATVISVKCETMESDACQRASEKQELHYVTSGRDGSHTPPTLNPVDHRAQRTKMREMAIQRAKQLQQEEEERTREQKAKALAKLEELNRRTLAESSNVKSNHAPPQISDVPNCKQESKPAATPSSDTTSNEASSGASVCLSEKVMQVDDSGIKKPGQSSDLSHNEAAKASQPVSQSSSMGQETNATTNTTKGTATDIQHNTVVKQKHVGYRKRHGVTQEKEITSSGTQAKDAGEIVVNVASDDNSPNEDSHVPQIKRDNKSAKNNNNNMLDEVAPNSTSPPPPHTERNTDKNHSESGTKPVMSVAEAISIPSDGSNKTVGTQSTKAVTAEIHGRVSNPSKPHPQRKTIRNQHTSRPISKYHVAEAVMWAPVKPQGKIDTYNEVSQNVVTEATKDLSAKGGNDSQNGKKTKRAEIERYVPKPVAKELSQQVNSQQIHPSLNSQTVESGWLDGPTVNKASVLSADTKNGVNSKHNKHGKTNASWRRRNSAESPSVEGSESSDQAKIVHKASGQPQPTDISDILKEPPTHFDDGWNDNNYNVIPSESVTSTVVSKSYGANRQRCRPYKAFNVSDGTNLHQGAGDTGENQSPSLGHNVLDNVLEGRIAGVEHLKSHWQPKSQTNRRENKVDELSPPDVGNQGEQAVLLGLNQCGQNTGRSQRSYDPSYRGRDVGQDVSKQNFHMHDGEKWKSSNQRAEYQRVESYDKPDDSFQQNPSSRERARETPRVPGSRYRGRGRNFPHGGV